MRKLIALVAALGLPRDDCPESDHGMHVLEDHFLPEIVDPDTFEPLPPGQPGELVFTTLTKEGLPLVRVANNGISALIDARGTVTAKTAWWKRTTLKGEVNLREGRTFFSRHGDYLGRIALVLGILFTVYGVIRRFG